MKKTDPVPLLRLKLSPEWVGQSGLWREEAGGGFWPVDAEEIGLSEALADRLEDWTDSFDAIYDEDDPAASRFASREDFEAFLAEGEALAELIRRETGATVFTQLPQGLGPTHG